MGERLDVEIAGEGRTLVLLHSLLSDRTSFDPLVARLKDQRRLILINLPGFGSSPAVEGGIAGFARAVEQVFDDLDLPKDTDVLGNGFGGFVALKLAIQAGDRFDRLVLAGSAVAFPEAGRATFRALADTVEKAGVAAVAEAAVKRMFPEEFIAANPKVAQGRAAVFKTINGPVFASACRALSTLDLGPELDKVRNTTLIVVGDKDGATPPALAHELAGRLADASVIELPGVGHYPQMQAPDVFLAAISDFLGLETPRRAAAH